MAVAAADGGGRGVAATGVGGSTGSTRNSSWLAPQEGQNRARALMRSPQLGQKMVSGTR